MEEQMEELVESILDYVRADYTDYAVMINGEWGSGKTYFWNNKVRNKIESMKLNRSILYNNIYVIVSEFQILKKSVKKYS
ncbi:MAG: hypothetical protein HFJ51_02945 [Clostridia bacterium]|nr:hypothetical protein [Clostridia bacterium]